MSGDVFDPGALNRRLVLEAPVETNDGSGGVARSFAAVATLWAAVEPASGRESVVADALGANITHRIRIRTRADVALRHRFRDGDIVFRIVAIRDRDRRFLDLDGEQRAD
jgi:SPP1 family predicted phage head-tail adaptor